MKTSVSCVRAALAASLLAACSGGDGAPDHASSFTGIWSGGGGVGLTSGSPPLTDRLPPGIAVLGMEITSTEPNTLELPGICPAELVAATVTSASSFTVGEHACAPVAEAGCSTPTTVHVDGGSGTIASGALAIGVTGTYEFCGVTYAFVYIFSGTRG